MADRLVLRQCCRVYLQPVPDDPTWLHWAHVIGPPTRVALHERVVELARSWKVTRGRKRRVDSTVVETPMHHPTDSGLLADGVQGLSRLLGRAKAVMGHVTDLGQAVFRRKTGQGAEFGRTVWLEEVEGGRISGYRILTEASQDFPDWPDNLDKWPDVAGNFPDGRPLLWLSSPLPRDHPLFWGRVIEGSFIAGDDF